MTANDQKPTPMGFFPSHERSRLRKTFLPVVGSQPKTVVRVIDPLIREVRTSPKTYHTVQMVEYPFQISSLNEFSYETRSKVL